MAQAVQGKPGKQPGLWNSGKDVLEGIQWLAANAEREFERYEFPTRNSPLPLIYSLKHSEVCVVSRLGLRFPYLAEESCTFLWPSLCPFLRLCLCCPTLCLSPRLCVTHAFYGAASSGHRSAQSGCKWARKPMTAIDMEHSLCYFSRYVIPNLR